MFGETHLKAYEHNTPIRIEQTKMIKSIFENQYQNIPVFIAGDFNEVPQKEPIADIMLSGFKDLYSIAAYTSKGSPRPH